MQTDPLSNCLSRSPDGIVQEPDIVHPAPNHFKYRDGESYLRARKIKSAERIRGGLLFRLETGIVTNHLNYTHETPLFQPGESREPGEDIYASVTFFKEDVIRIRYHLNRDFKDPYEKMPLDMRMLCTEPEKIDPEIEETENAFTLTTSALTAEIGKSLFSVKVLDPGGEEVFRQFRFKPNTPMWSGDVFDLRIDPNNACVFESIPLDEDEEIYGLGERFDSVSRRGRTVDFRNQDASGTTSRRTYMNIPFFMSTKGYGIFLNTSAPTFFDIGCSDAFTLQFAVSDSQMDYFIIPGPTPAEVLCRYCSLTGFSKLPPLWSFGLWMSRNSYITWDVAEEVGKEMRARHIPCDVLHLDTAWFTEDWNCDLKFSKERFPDPEEHLKKLKEQGFHVSLWQYSFIPPKDNNANYKVAKEKGYLATKDDGTPYRMPDHCHGGWVDDATIDFTNPETRKWYGNMIRDLIAMGGAAIKTDFGEGIPEMAHYANLDGKYIHNYYTLPYNHTVFHATKDVSGDQIVWARSGTAGSQRFPLHWGGDSQCTFEGLAGTLRGALSSGLSGIPFFSHDIGGFIGMPDAELYIRWAQLGLFSSHSRCHGAGNDGYREPWKYGEEAERIFKKYAELRYSLMPYIYDQAKKSVATGLPVMRALWLMHPEDRNVRHIEDQYYFGEDLLVAPILKPISSARTRDVYLPKGVWYDFWTDEKIESFGQWIRVESKLDTLPVFVRSGTRLQFASPVENLASGMPPVVSVKDYR